MNVVKTILDSVRLLVSSPAHYATRLARNVAEVRSAQAMRFQVFNLELNEGLEQSYATGLDEDPFDAVCDHLVVEHLPSATIVGTYRLQTGQNAATHLGYCNVTSTGSVKTSTSLTGTSAGFNATGACPWRTLEGKRPISPQICLKSHSGRAMLYGNRTKWPSVRCHPSDFAGNLATDRVVVSGLWPDGSSRRLDATPCRPPALCLGCAEGDDGSVLKFSMT